MTVTGDAGALPGEVDRVAFGIVREAVTNAVRHAPQAAEVRVSLVREPGLLRVRVTDDGGTRPAGERDRAGGQGLRGLAERVRALHGDLDAAPGPDGFVVTAELPLDTADARRTGERAPDRARVPGFGERSAGGVADGGGVAGGGAGHG
ncbi:sensor histidine kinase [Pseudonocardia nantongensis]|uniref:sensor histidine kinase n=1 Tax=Pseudonocardia nantongensis TaxID=1181885 RepID=UPI00397AB981